jgi:hypothetical protein
MTEANIARKLEVTRQTIHKSLNTANTRISESLEETARINKLEIQSINSDKGFLVGYSQHFKTRALVTFSAKNGMQIWYKHEGHCEKCTKKLACKEMLISEAKDRGISIPEGSTPMSPSEFSEVLFSKMTGE